MKNKELNNDKQQTEIFLAKIIYKIINNLIIYSVMKTLVG